MPFLFVLTFFRAIASCSSICDCRCLSLFCSMSSCDRRPKMAFFGLSFRFWAVPPPNQPQIPDIFPGGFETESLQLCDSRFYVREKAVACPRSRVTAAARCVAGWIDGGVRRKQAAV